MVSGTVSHHAGHDNALAPNDSNILAEVCRFSNVAGLRHHGKLVDRIGSIDPLTSLTPLVFSCYHWLGGRHDLIAPFARRAIEMAPAPSMLHIIAGWQLDAAGHSAEGAEVLRATGAALAGSVLGAWASFHECALAGDEPRATASASGLDGALRNEFAAIMMAEACALVGRRDDAIRWARQAVTFGFVNYPFLSGHSRYLTRLCGDAEYQMLLGEVKPRWERVVAWEQSREAAHRR